jgi:alpha-glucosidase
VAAIPTPSRALSTWVTRQVSNATCPGYAASNVETTDSSLTADLKLAGTACNIYSDDLLELKLLVEYQSGASRL